ncbi:MAG: uncharacterized protein KVP18_000911 [Porospora cf. gigantea A]|uniref:uncharacterized protein n=1 Tax=Porospora cf. gigantea A TaxID=2853593 RepID=UPI00355A78E2|nr:MAG: hypothetical protein KVP18_000911 [Porospora cf. gigantea A]
MPPVFSIRLQKLIQQLLPLLCDRRPLLGVGLNTAGQLGMGPPVFDAVDPVIRSADPQIREEESRRNALGVSPWWVQHWGFLSSPVSGNLLREVAAGEEFTLALTRLGSVWSTENHIPFAGELKRRRYQFKGAPTASSVGLWREVTLRGVVDSIACGARFAAAVLKTGELFSWGSHEDNCLGYEADCVVSYPRQVPIPEPVVSVSCGVMHAACITRQRHVYVWGKNEVGQLGMPGDPELVIKPTPLNILEFPATRDGFFNVEPLRDAWRYLAAYTCNLVLDPYTFSFLLNVRAPHPMPAALTFVDASCGESHSLFLAEMRVKPPFPLYHVEVLASDENHLPTPPLTCIFAAGLDEGGQLGLHPGLSGQSEVEVNELPSLSCEAVVNTESVKLALFDFKWIALGSTVNWRESTRAASTRSLRPLLQKCAQGNICAATGSNVPQAAQLAAIFTQAYRMEGSNVVPPLRRVPMSLVMHAESVHAGATTSFGRSSDGQVYAWGSNHEGQLGLPREYLPGLLLLKKPAAQLPHFEVFPCPTLVPLLRNRRDVHFMKVVTAKGARTPRTYFLLSDGEVVVVGGSRCDVYGASGRSTFTQNSPVVRCHAEYQWSYYNQRSLYKKYAITCFGEDSYCRPSLVDTPQFLRTVDIAAGGCHTILLTERRQ